MQAAVRVAVLRALLLASDGCPAGVGRCGVGPRSAHSAAAVFSPPHLTVTEVLQSGGQEKKYDALTKRDDSKGRTSREGASRADDFLIGVMLIGGCPTRTCPTGSTKCARAVRVGTKWSGAQSNTRKPRGVAGRAV